MLDVIFPDTLRKTGPTLLEDVDRKVFSLCVVCVETCVMLRGKPRHEHREAAPTVNIKTDAVPSCRPDVCLNL